MQWSNLHQPELPQQPRPWSQTTEGAGGSSFPGSLCTMRIASSRLPSRPLRTPHRSSRPIACTHAHSITAVLSASQHERYACEHTG
eukprot:6205374-Pleurochrysis_carterae.AAC.3